MPTELVVATDPNVIYGFGRGWLGAMDYAGAHDGRAVAGTAYYEYVDTSAPGRAVISRSRSETPERIR